MKRVYYVFRFLLVVLICVLLVSCKKSEPTWFQFTPDQQVSYAYEYKSSGQYLGEGLNFNFDSTTSGILNVVVFEVSENGYTLGFTATNIKVVSKANNTEIPVAIPLVARYSSSGKLTEFTVNANALEVLNDHLKTLIMEIQLIKPAGLEPFKAQFTDSVGTVTATFTYAGDSPRVTRVKEQYSQLAGVGFGTRDKAEIKQSFLEAEFSLDSNWLHAVSGTERLVINKNAGHTINLNSEFSLRHTDTVHSVDKSDPESFMAMHDDVLHQYSEEMMNLDDVLPLPPEPEAARKSPLEELLAQ